MLQNVPDSQQLNSIALRLYFDAWERTVMLFFDFCEVFEIEIDKVTGQHRFFGEWDEYVAEAQAEMGAICALIQQAAEIRLKSIICSVSPYLLLLNGEVPLKASETDLDFTSLRTLDAVDLPKAVRTLTEFKLSDAYIQEYGELRKRRNQFAHLGSHHGGLSPSVLVDLLGQQYVSLWPDGHWLLKRTKYDGNSARRFFHDDRYSSVESTVMGELPITMALLNNKIFKSALGVAKGKVSGFCPDCVHAIARKSGIEAVATTYQTSASTASCLMCEVEITLSNSSNNCSGCGGALDASTSAADDDWPSTVRYGCGG